MAYEESDLHISQSELDGITEALANNGHTDALTKVMAEAEQKVDDYTSTYTVPATTKERIWRVLVLYAVQALLSQISKARQDAYDDAMQELKDIRDGKFGFPLVSTTDNTPSGDWGSQTLIE